VRQLGHLPWLPQVAAEGWLLGLAIDWCDGTRADTAAGWPAAALALPLWVAPAPQISERGLAFWLSSPGLYMLDLPGRANLNPAVTLLGAAAGLRVLQVLVTDKGDLPVLEQVSRLAGLRRLVLQGGDRPTDDDLAALSGLTGLRSLTISFSQRLTDAGLRHLSHLRGLRRLRLKSCDRVTGAGAKSLQAALPGLKLEM
jgi:hypothetical protein